MLFYWGWLQLRIGLRSNQRFPLHCSAVFRFVRQFLSCVTIASVAAAYSASTIAQEVSLRPGVSPAAVEDHGSSQPQPLKGILELRNSFWHLKQLQGASPNVSDVVVRILIVTPDGANGTITFSTPSYFIAFPFVYKSTGLEFYAAYSHGGTAKDAGFPQAQQAAQIFENALQKACCYEVRSSVLTLMDREQHPLIVLSPVQQDGLENRRWRIIRYRGRKSTEKDELTDAMEPADVTFINGRVEGSPGCGAWSGTYRASGDHLTFDVGTFLSGLCSSDQLAEKYWVERDLNGATQIERDGGNILLRDRNGRAMILLVPF
jgi:heat shock protein HslJ